MKVTYVKNVLILLMHFIPSLFCDDEFDGQVLYIQHSLESSGLEPVYTSRGSIITYPSKNEAVYKQDKPLSTSEIDKLRKLANSDDIYRVKLLSKLEEPSNSVFSFTKACAIYESNLSDTVTVSVDQSGLPVGIAVSSSSPHCTGIHVSDAKLMMFNTSVNLVMLVNGPAPDTLTYIQRLEQEKAEKARGEQGDNRSFFAKYWMYIIPFVLLLFISGASGPEGQAAGR